MILENLNRNDFERIMPPNIIDDYKPEEKYIFIDNVIYNVIIDENDNILAIINHTDNKVSESEIEKIAMQILNKKQKETKLN